MSATVSDPRRLANVYLGIASPEIVAVAGQRGFGDPESCLPVATDEAKSRTSYDCSEKHTSMFTNFLVFVNSRKQVDAAAGYYRFRRFSGCCPVLPAHMGAWPRLNERKPEYRFKSVPKRSALRP